MQNIPTAVTGFGETIAAQLGIGVTVTDKAASYTILEPESGTIYTNRGATGTTTFTLPVPQRNRWFGFLKPAAQTLVIAASGGAKINGGTANKKYQNVGATDAGFGACFLICDDVDWYVIGEKGTWANDNS